MSSNTRVTKSKGQPEAVSLPTRMRQSRNSTNTSDQPPPKHCTWLGPVTTGYTCTNIRTITPITKAYFFTIYYRSHSGSATAFQGIICNGYC